MENKLLHTPDGVRDIYGKECSDRLFIQKKIDEIFAKYGYNNIKTPSFEFFEVFSEERGSVPSNDLYKFFDREGNTLVLRPDITPSIARCASKFFSDDEFPVRLCYCGNIFVNNSEFQGKLKEQTQAGAELICDDSPFADAEMVVMVIESMIASGLKEFQVELGQAGFFKGIIKEAGISNEVKLEIINLIEKKNLFGIEETLKKYGVDDKYIKIFAKLPELFGDVSVLESAKEFTDNEEAIKAIDNLLAIYEIIKSYGLESYVSFDLGMLSNYEYYTGVIFKGYTYGAGESLVGGGRYNNLLKQFGKDAPAVGFGINIDRLMLALERQNIEINSERQRHLIIFDDEKLDEAVKTAADLRKKNECVLMLSSKQIKDEKELDLYKERNRVNSLHKLF